MKVAFLSHFTPSMMPPETLEAILVQRQEIAQDLVERIRASVFTPAKHHSLVVGSRGIGKTHLVSLIYYRVRAMADLQDRLLIAWLREEEWGVASFLDLLIRIFRALEEEDPTIAERVELLYSLSPEEAEDAGARLLKEWIGDRTLLLLIENLDDLFNGLGEQGQKRLRAFLQENVCCTILATSQSLFNGVSRRTAPFFGFFRPVSLKKLTLEDATQLLRNIAKLRDNRELEEFIQTPTGRARIRAVEHLAGGNPRVYVILAQFLSRESLDDLVEPFMNMLDELTPYYQARMMYLSPQQRKIVEFLCDRGNAIPVKEIAQRCFITHQTASSQLKDLREKGYVQSQAVGRESYYELCEPLMRLCIEVKKHRGKPIRLFVDFLRLWYTPTELREQLELLSPDAKLEQEYILHTLRIIQKDTQDPRVAKCQKDFATYFQKEDFVHALQVAEELVTIRGSAYDWLNQGGCLVGIERYDEALASLERAIELQPDIGGLWIGKGSILILLEQYESSLESFRHAIELQPDEARAWECQGHLLDILGRYEEAISSWREAVKLSPNAVKLRMDYFNALLNFGNFEEALASISEGIEIDPKSNLLWAMKSLMLMSFGRYQEALLASNQAIQLGYQFPPPFFHRAAALLALDFWEKGIEALDEALHRFVSSEEPATRDSELIISNLLSNTNNSEIWRSRLATLIEVYDKHQVTTALPQGLVQSIPSLLSPMVSDTAAQAWQEVWVESVGKRDEFQLPLRLLKVAVRYKQTPDDPRVLLELPVEERKLLEPLLGINQEPSEGKF